MLCIDPRMKITGFQSMRIAIFLLPVFLVACSAPSDHPGDTDTLSRDTMNSADNDFVVPVEAIIIDSFDYHHIRVIQSDTSSSTYLLDFEIDGDHYSTLLSDSFLWTPHVELDTIQMNEVSGKEVIIRQSALRESGGWGDNAAISESYCCYYVYDVDNQRMLFQGVSANYYRYICPNENNPGCKGKEIGYKYDVVFSPAVIDISRPDYFGDSSAAKVDHPPGRYEWHDGMFVRMSE